MPVIFLIILGILWLIAILKAILFWVYLWQLKEYHIKRFIDHFRTAKGKSLLFDKFRIAKIFLFILSFFNSFYFLVLIFLVYFIELKRGIRRPIFTLKTIALIFISLFFSMFISAIWFPAGFLLIDILMPIIVLMFILILKPIIYSFVKQLLRKARKKREEFKNLIAIGIAGSYGKSSVKEFLYEVLSEKYKVLKTEKNNNSETGIAKTILDKLNSSHQIFIVEMGAYERGRIKEDCKMVQPKIGILTGINQQHMATFGSQENIIKAKNEIFECLPKDGIKIKKDNLNLRVTDIIVNKENILFKINSVDFNVNLLGKHNLDNILLVIDCALKLGMNLEQISKACLKIKENKIIKREPVIINNSYSANPTGTISDIEYLKLYSGKKAVVMPCLIELGKASEEVHRGIGKKLNEVVDLAIITTKDWFKAIEQECPKAIYFENSEEIIEKIRNFDVILIEGRISKNILEKIKCL